MRLFGYELQLRKAAAARGRAAQAFGRPSWYWAPGRTRWSPAIPLEKELEVYEDMRRLFPVIDAAIAKLVWLCGCVEVAGSERVQADLGGWLRTVPVNQCQQGLQAWLETHLDQTLFYGKSVGEIVPSRARDEVFALTNLATRSIELAPGPTPLSLRILQRQPGQPSLVEIPSPWVIYTVHRPRGDDPHGSSLLRSCPFAAEVLSIIANATGQVWKRMGAPPYHVKWVPDAGFVDPDGTLAQSYVEAIATQFQDAMSARDSGQIKDFFTSGDVEVKVIGSDAQLLALQEPFRAFEEQIVAATGLPAWMLGLHWSSTERLSVQQADMIVANIASLRRAVQPEIDRLCDLRQRLVGRSGRFTLQWPAVNLRDLTETAKGEAWHEQGRARRIENGRRMWELGYWTQEQAARDADSTLERVATEYRVPPTGAERQADMLTPAG